MFTYIHGIKYQNISVMSKNNTIVFINHVVTKLDDLNLRIYACNIVILVDNAI